MCAILVTIVVLFIVLYSYALNNIYEQLNKSENRQLLNYQQKGETIFDDIETTAMQISKYFSVYKNEITSYELSQKDPLTAKNILKFNDILLSKYDYVKSIYIYFDGHNRFVRNYEYANFDTFSDKDWLGEYIKIIKENSNTRHLWLYSRKVADIAFGAYENASESITLVMPMDNNGYVVINLDADEVYKAIFYNADNYYVIYKNSIILGDKKNFNGTFNADKYNKYESITTTDKKKKEFFSLQPTLNQRKYIVFIDNTSISLSTVSFSIMVISIFIISILLIMFILYKLFINFYKPINELIASLNGEEDKVYDEFEFIKNKVNNVLTEKSNIVNDLKFKNMIYAETVLRKYLRNEISSITDSNIREQLEKMKGICVVSFENYAEDFNDEQSETFQKIIREYFGFQIIKHDAILIYMHPNLVSLIINDEAREEKNLENQLESIVTNFKLNNINYIVIGVGGYIDNFSDLNASYIQSIEAIEYRIYFEDNSVIFFKDIANYTNDNVSDEIYELQKQIVVYVKDRNLNKANRLVDDYFEGLDGNITPQKYLECVGLLKDALFKIPIRLGCGLEEIFYNDYKSIIESNKYISKKEEYKEYIKFVVKSIITSLTLKITNKNSELIADIKQYVMEHLEGDLSLSTIASLYGISSSQYLSIIFKQETGETFLKYLTDVRMNEAMSLLKETKLNPADISTKIGYLNTRSFYAIFKKYTGDTPNEYRKKHN